MEIKNIKVREIFDSRSEPTLEVEIMGENSILGIAQIPSGKSRGKSEAVVKNFHEAKIACGKFLEGKLAGKGFNSIKNFDEFLLEIDNTENKEKIGGNLSLGASVAFARLLAIGRKKEVWEVLQDEFFENNKTSSAPFIFSNLINGGAHACSNLNIQEYMVVAKSESVKKSVSSLISLYKELGSLLKRKQKAKRIGIGDEGGYAMDFKDNFEPIQILEKLIYKHKLESEFKIGLDVAATNFFKSGKYSFESKKLTIKELVGTYKSYFKKSKLLFSIEDPFAENDFDGWKELMSEIKDKLVVGDDITVTNSKRIAQFNATGLINGVIIKPNQIGTITETCEALRVAKENDVKTIISHRSGETDDNFIIHLAKASNAYGVKIGAPARERIFKFNELMRLYAQ